MKKHFNNILTDLQKFADAKAQAGIDKAEIEKNENFSQLAKEKKSNEIDESLKVLGLRLSQETGKDFEDILSLAEKNDAHCEMAEMSGLFGYIASAGAKCNVDVLKGQIAQYRGHFSMMQAIYDVLENAGASTECKQVVKGYILNYKTEIEDTAYDCEGVFVSKASASTQGKKVVKLAEKLGIDIETVVTDEVADNSALRSAFGLN